MNHTLHKALAIIGTEGFDGVEKQGRSVVEAFYSILGDNRTNPYMELRRQKLISAAKLPDNTYRFTLTPAGAQRLMKWNIEAITIPKPEKWDSHWHLLCYDFPKGRDKERLYFNRRLHALGLIMIQRSLWAYPYPFSTEVTEIASYLNLNRYTSYIEAIALDPAIEKRLRAQYQI